MERRLTAFLLPVLLVALGLTFFLPKLTEDKTDAPPPLPAAVPAPAVGNAAPPGSAAPTQGDLTVDKTFGDYGERGSFYIVFDRRLASVRRIYMIDEPRTPQARKQGSWGFAQSYDLVYPVQRGIVSLGLAEAKSRLGVDLNSAWDVDDTLGPDAIAFTLRDDANGLTLRREYRHFPGERELLLTVELAADDSRPAPTEPSADRLSAGAEIPMWLYGASVSNPSTEHVLGNPAVAIGRMVDAQAGTELVESLRADGKPNGPNSERRVAYSSGNAMVDFAGTTNRFFGVFLRPANEAAVRSLWLVEMEKWPNPAIPQPGVGNHGPFSTPVTNYRMKLKVPRDGERTVLDFRLYIGPKSAGVFDEDPEYERYNAVMDVDLTPIGCFCDIPGAKFMSKTLLWGLRGLHGLVGSWGFAIVLLTLIVRGSLVPLNFRMQKSMRVYGAKAARLAPELEAIKQRNKNDPKKLQQEMMAFQRQHKLFPPLGGCLPLLITIPVFIGLFTALRVAYELRCQPFIGWIDDLSKPDQLFEIGLSWLPHFNLLPLLMVGLWLWLQAGTPLPKDPQQRQVMKIMRFMPLLFGVMLYSYASGLMVYMITSSALGLVEQRVTKRILGPPPEVGGVGAVPTF